MTQSPVIGVFQDFPSGQRAAMALEDVGFDEVTLFTADDYNSGLVPADPKENRKTMERSFAGAAIGLVVGAAVGWMLGWPIGRMWAALGSVLMAGIGATAGFLLGDRGANPYEAILTQGGVLISVRFENPARVSEAVNLLKRLGARQVSVNTPGAQMPAEGS